MELDELKNTWLALDKKLGENNSLNDRIIKEMLKTKSNKSIGRLIGYEVFSLCVLLMILPLIVYLWIDSARTSQFMAGAVFLISMFVFTVLLIIWTGIKIAILIKIDLSKEIAENIRRTNRYNILIKREKLGSIFLIPVLGILCSYLYAQVNAHVTLWVFMTCLFIILVLYTIWAYKRIYDKNISSIMRSLEELKELEEE